MSSLTFLLDRRFVRLQCTCVHSVDDNGVTRPATLADVAARVGVSGKTVSRVINRDPNVSEKTRRKIEAAIAETGFRPNLAARSLAAARSFLIGVLGPDAASHYHSEIYRGAARACRTHGYHLLLEEFDSRQADLVSAYENGLRSARCDGVILPPPLCDDMALLEALDRDRVRYVRLAPGRDAERSPAIFADDARGVADLAHHLWEAGHRRFGIVAGPKDHAATAIRRDAFVKTVSALGGEAAQVTVVDVVWGGSIVSSGRDAARILLAHRPRPTAVFGFNDEIAAGVMIHAREIGLRLPDDLAVAGFDDSESARLTWPQLTTIRQPIADMGARAVEAIVTAAASGPERIECSVELVIRGSTQPPEAEARP